VLLSSRIFLCVSFPCAPVVTTIQRNQKRHFSDQEIINNASLYAEKLSNQLDKFSQRIALLDTQHEQSNQLIDAKNNYDIQRIIKLLKQKKELDDKQSAQTNFELAEFQNLNLDYDQAYKNYKISVLLDEKNSTYLNAFGLFNIKVGKYDQALHAFKSSLYIDLKTFGEHHPSVARTRNNLGIVWQYKGDLNKAIGYYKQALDSLIKTFGTQHQHIARIRHNLGSAWHDKGDYDKAIGDYKQSLDRNITIFGEYHPRVAATRNNLGSTLRAIGDYDKALGYYKQALDSDIKTFGEQHPRVAATRNNLGSTWLDKGN